MRSLRTLGLLVLVAFAASCGGGNEDSGPTPGFLDLTLNTPNSNDGAVLFRVIGGVIDSVTGGAMVQDGSYTVQPSYTRIVAAGDITDGVVARIHVPNTRDVGDYSVIMEQVAVRNTFVQRALTGYTVSISKTP